MFQNRSQSLEDKGKGEIGKSGKQKTLAFQIWSYFCYTTILRQMSALFLQATTILCFFLSFAEKVHFVPKPFVALYLFLSTECVPLKLFEVYYTVAYDVFMNGQLLRWDKMRWVFR